MPLPIESAQVLWPQRDNKLKVNGDGHLGFDKIDPACLQRLGDIRDELLGGESNRSSSLLATSLAPPTFPEASSRLAIQRRAVRMDTPVSRAIPAARRYSVPSVIFASPEGGRVVWGNHPLAGAQSIRGRLAEQAGAQCRLARLVPNWRSSWYLGEHGS
jgi:hypothetical protein